MPPVVMHTSAPITELFQQNATRRGLTMDDIPQAVQIAVSTLQESIVGPLYKLLAELPADARGFDWMAAAFAGFAEFADHTIVADQTITPESGNAPGTDGDAPGGEGGTSA